MRAPEHDGGAPVVGVVFAVVVAVNVAAGSAALEEHLNDARSALSRTWRTVAAVVARGAAAIAAEGDATAPSPAPPVVCPPPRTRHAEMRLAPCGVQIRCDTRRHSGHTRIVCRTPS